jgi:hypothetical protein
MNLKGQGRNKRIRLLVPESFKEQAFASSHVEVVVASVVDVREKKRIAK